MKLVFLNKYEITNGNKKSTVPWLTSVDKPRKKPTKRYEYFPPILKWIKCASDIKNKLYNSEYSLIYQTLDVIEIKNKPAKVETSWLFVFLYTILKRTKVIANKM